MIILDYWLGTRKQGGNCGRWVRRWRWRRGRRRVREEVLVKNDVSRHKNAASGSIQTFIPLMLLTIPKKNAKARAIGELPIVVGTQIRPASATESTKKGVVRLFSTEASKRASVLEILSRHAVDQVDCSKKGLVPEADRERGVGEKGNVCLHNMPVFPFCNAILLRCMRAG
jgi:hypothetical protein